MQLLIDANSIMHRSYHALPPLTMTDRRPAGAIYGFFSSFIRAYDLFHPTTIIAAFDCPEPTFRHKEFEDYKAKRVETPQPLRQQFSMIKEMLPPIGINVCFLSGYEADDIIGSLISPPTVILSGDQDFLQLIRPGVQVGLFQGKDIIVFDEEKMKEKYGFLPNQMTFYKSLCGDSSDNIPGVPGIGKKTALDLVQRFSSLDHLYQSLSELPSSLQQKLSSNEEIARQSLHLASICCDVSINNKWQAFSLDKLTEVLRESGFTSLVKRLGFDGQMKIF